MVAKRLSLNRTKGPIFGGIFASRLAKYFEIPIRHYEKEEKVLRTIFLGYKTMVAHDFICDDKEKRLIYNLVFSEKTCQIITLPAPFLFNIYSGMYIILPDTFMHIGSEHDPQSLSRSHNLILTVSLFTSGIRRRSPTSGTPRILLSTPERVTLIHGHRPT